MIKPKNRAFLFSFFLSLFSLASLFSASAASLKETVVLIDVSGSMKSPDPSRDTLQFAQLLVDLHQNGNNKIGFVAFHEDIALSIPPTTITDFNADAIKAELQGLSYTKNTDLGLGLKTVVDMLKGSRGQILLLSDGEVELVKSTKKRSNQDNRSDQEAALAVCIANDIPIHAISLDTASENDREATRALGEQSGGSFLALNPRSPLLPQYLSAYAESQDLSLSKVGGFQSNGTGQAVDIALPQITYMRDLNYILFSSAQLDACRYNDASTARISIGKNYAAVHNASDNLETQQVVFQAPAGTEVEIYTLKQLHFVPLLRYDEEKREFQAMLVDPDTQENISSTTALPVKVSVYKGAETLDSLALTRDEETYWRAYKPAVPGDYTADASVSIDSKEIHSEKISLPFILPGPVAIQADALQLKKNQVFSIDPGDYFEYANKADLRYTLTDSNLTGEIRSEGGRIVLDKPGLNQDGYILLEASDPYGQTANSRIPVRVDLSMAVFLASIFAGLLLLMALLLLLFNWKRKRRVFFDGALQGHFISTRHGRDLPEFLCLKDALAQKSTLSLQELFDLANVNESLPESRNIHFKAQANGELLLWHNTNCKILVESETVQRGQKFALRYGNRLFIFFEDDSTELELQYLQGNPNSGSVQSKFSVKMR